MAPLVGLAAIAGGFFFLVLVPMLLVELLVEHRRNRRHAVGLLICSAMIAGYLAGGILCWNLVAAEWNMPFWTTVQASVDAEKYGHPLEHRAEVILVWVLFCGVAGGLASGAGAAVAAGLRTRLQRA